LAGGQRQEATVPVRLLLAWRDVLGAAMHDDRPSSPAVAVDFRLKHAASLGAWGLVVSPRASGLERGHLSPNRVHRGREQQDQIAGASHFQGGFDRLGFAEDPLNPLRRKTGFDRAPAEQGDHRPVGAAAAVWVLAEDQVVEHARGDRSHFQDVFVAPIAREC
jgi:hypothetical protein